MTDDGATKDDVKIPDGEIGDKIRKLFVDEGKDTSECTPPSADEGPMLTETQTLSFSLPWVRRLPLTPRRLPNK